MATNDLLNLRWQHIRAVEMGQLQQQEILRLKDLLREKEIDHGSNQKAFEAQRSGLKKSLIKMKKILFLLKCDLVATKKEYSSELVVAKDEFWKLKSSHKEIELRCGKASLNAERLTIENEMLHKQIVDYEKIAQNATTKAAVEYNALLAKLDALTEAHNRSVLDCEMKEKAIGAIRTEKDALSERFEMSKDKISQLQKAMRKMQEDSNVQVDDIKKAHQSKCQEYEERIQSLTVDNMEMSDDIRHLQKEIEKLIAAQNVPKKSNFSKYVELKTENAQLQAQMAEITRRQSVMGNRRMSQQPVAGDSEPSASSGGGAGIVRRTSSLRKQSTQPLRLSSTDSASQEGGNGQQRAMHAQGNETNGDAKTLMSLSARSPSGSFSKENGSGMQSSMTGPSEQISNQQSSSGFPPRRPSQGSAGGEMGAIGTTTSSVLGVQETAMPTSRRSSMNDELELSGGSGSFNMTHIHRGVAPSHLTDASTRTSIDLSPKVGASGDRKVSPRPSQYRADSRIVSGEFSDATRHGDAVSPIDTTSSEPPVYNGFAGSNLRKKSTMSSSAASAGGISSRMGR